MTPIERLKRRIDIHLQNEQTIVDDINELKNNKHMTVKDMKELLLYMFNHPFAKQHLDNPKDIIKTVEKARKFVGIRPKVSQ